MSTPAFRLTALTHRYRRRGRRPPTLALDGVTADLPRGRVGVLGLSGSGKTTLLNLLGLLDDTAPDAGTLEYLLPPATPGGPPRPRSYTTTSRGEKARLRRTEFGFVLQSALLLPHLSCLENVALPLAIAGVRRRERLDWAEHLFRSLDPTGQLLHLRHDHPRNVSGGERQRVAILRAIAHNPRVLFADEPFSSLDRRNTDQVLALLASWADQADAGPPRTVVLVSHAVRDTLTFTSGRCLILRDRQAVRRPDQPTTSVADAHRLMGVT